MMHHLDVEWILPDGKLGGRTPDGTFKVRGATLGDRIAVREATSRGRTLEVASWEVVTPSPHRVVHPCLVQQACGGCDLGTLAPDVRRGQLQEIVRRALRLDETPTWVPSPRPRRHRARVRLGIDGTSMGYRESRSHTLVQVDDCLAAREEVAARIAEVASALPIPGATAVEIRSDGSRAVLAFEGRITPADLGGLDDVAVDGRTVRGDPVLTLPGVVPLRASPRSFFQVNLEANAALVALAVEALGEIRAERVLDLYAGIGNFALPLAHAGMPVVAVELEGQAVADLRVNASGWPIEVIGADVGRFDPSRTPFDAVVLDPPRAGAPGVMARLLRQRPRRVVMVSCHAPSGGRDLEPLRKAGYRVVRAYAADLFPDTHHVEAVVVLDRPGSPGARAPAV